MPNIIRTGSSNRKLNLSAKTTDVLTGKTFSVDGKDTLTGAMANIGAVNQALAINGTYTIPAGYHNGSGKVTQNITTLGATTYTPKTTDQTIASGRYLSGTQTIKGDANLVAGNIVSGKTIFGVAGSVIPSGNQYNLYDCRTLVIGMSYSDYARTYNVGAINLANSIIIVDAGGRKSEYGGISALSTGTATILGYTITVTSTGDVSIKGSSSLSSNYFSLPTTITIIEFRNLKSLQVFNRSRFTEGETNFSYYSAGTSVYVNGYHKTINSVDPKKTMIFQMLHNLSNYAICNIGLLSSTRVGYMFNVFEHDTVSFAVVEFI